MVDPMKSYQYMHELSQKQLDQVGREIERMHEESIRNIQRAIAALRVGEEGSNDSSRNLQNYSS